MLVKDRFKFYFIEINCLMNNVNDRVFFSLVLRAQEKLFLHGRLQRKVGCPLSLHLVQSSQIVKKVVQQGLMKCFQLQGET